VALGKAKPFRKDSGKAAGTRNFAKNQEVCRFVTNRTKIFSLELDATFEAQPHGIFSGSQLSNTS
jgi:hypothetical protein